MKLRIKGDSLRLRIAPSELKRLLAEGRVEETVHFAAHESACLTYALEQSEAAGELAVGYMPGRVTVLVPTAHARQWADGNEVGMYGAVDLLHGQLEVAVEKDWACLDKSNSGNEDTFPNPSEGAAC
jgi:hypothetical protein